MVQLKSKNGLARRHSREIKNRPKRRAHSEASCSGHSGKAIKEIFKGVGARKGMTRMAKGEAAREACQEDNETVTLKPFECQRGSNEKPTRGGIEDNPTP